MAQTRLTPAAWLDSLLAPASRLNFTTATYLGRWSLNHWKIAPRSLDEHLIYWVASGAAEGRLITAARAASHSPSIVLTAGSFVWIMPGVAHAFWQAAGCRRLVLYNLRFALIANRNSHPRLATDLLTAPRSVELEPYIAALVQELAAAGERAVARTARRRRHPATAPASHAAPFHKALLAQLVIQMLRAAERPADAPPTLNRFQRDLLQRHVENHAAERILPADLAKLCDLSPDYFTRLFRRTYQLPPRAWILRQRIRLAAVALAQSTDNVSQIALQLGYPDVYLFSRQFKQVIGVSPRQYRLHADAPPPAGRMRE